MAENFNQKLKQLLIRFLARRLPPCDAVTKLLSASLDRQTTVSERLTMRLHLFTCDACRRYLEQIRVMRDLFQTDELSGSEKQTNLPDAARERIRAAIKAAGQKPK